MRLDQQPVRAVPKVTRKPNRKKKKVELYKGVKVPSRKARGQIDKKNYDKAMEKYEYQCAECGISVGLEMHHIVFRSDSGRKGWRNLVPLCKLHHDFCHEKFPNKELRETYSGWYADMWREKHEMLYGPFFAADKYDLWKAGLIPNCTDQAFDSFMDWEEVKACDSLGR
ncbi:HNH endonuclease [Halalkalibacter krulwichiae]|uniref:HNH endonuclease n=1 Tax=Halalkalibacter krulwichiae TaxID=199441 RepID=A0A1X9M5N9_9BACI|nr:HNH endonuclease [Halalkalibacter krulwichiae]ARK28766.1 HNH endonuclease [Halalkalibacter krulwichiae]